jgi:hypothetical protein
VIDLSKFYVITPIVNSPAFKTRAENYWKFKKMIDAAGVKLLTVEVAFGDRPFEVTERDNPMHLQLRSVDELWLKERQINLGINYLMQMDPDAKQIAWVDSDCFPMSPPREWFEKTKSALDHYEFVQMWEWLLDFGPDYQPLAAPKRSFMAAYEFNGFKIPKARVPKRKHTLSGSQEYYNTITIGAPGLAWAANVPALSAVGGLLDINILGSGDWHMAHGLLGAMEKKSPEYKLKEYGAMMLEWQDLALRYVKKDVGYVKMTVGHWFHGDKVDRQYGTRGEILLESKFNPRKDLKVDAQGLWQLETHTPRQIRLRDRLRLHFQTRNEDSVPHRKFPIIKKQTNPEV